MSVVLTFKLAWVFVFFVLLEGISALETRFLSWLKGGSLQTDSSPAEALVTRRCLSGLSLAHQKLLVSSLVSFQYNTA